jgi:class 3 adenylate cyclase/tetratricopeptide (TPR) repeat protein
MTMLCSSCGAGNPAGNKFCGDCGALLGARCSQCGADNPADKRFCGDCGAPLAASARAARSPAPAPDVADTRDRTGADAFATASERRHVTSLFCDLVSSTEIAARLDPEEWHEVAAHYQRAAAAAVTRLGGHVAKYLGDGLVVHFGYPEAHGDDAEQAVRAGLAIVEAVARLNDNLGKDHDVTLSVRVGIHSGSVVVGHGGGKEADVFGDTPNIAARVQVAALPDSVFITAAVNQLVAGLFVVEDRGAHALKGIQQPIQLYRVLQPSAVRRRTRGAHTLTPFVGRQGEMRLLLSRWERAREGQGHLALVVGEPGIGKSRLVEEFRATIKDDVHLWVECAGEQFSAATPFRAVIQILNQGLGCHGDESQEERVNQLERSLQLAGMKLADAVPLIAEMLNLTIPKKYRPLTFAPDQKRKRLLAGLAGWVFGAARVQPLVMAIEDLHWLDPSTLELTQMLVEQSATVPLLLLCTARPEFRAPWPMRAHHVQITLGRLNDRQTREMVAGVAARSAMTKEVLDTVVRRTDGVPLFAEELARLVLDGAGRAFAREIPATLRDSLAARLDRLGSAKQVAQLAAVIGREFSYDVIRAVSPLPENEIRSALEKLTDAELIYSRGIPPEATYQFKHALIQDAAYESLLKSIRHQYHGQIARVLKEQCVKIGGGQPELLAHHYTEGRLFEEAVPCWLQAGQEAARESANAEALVHLRRGLELLSTLPERPESAQQELAFQAALGPVLIALRGWSAAETEAAYKRAVELCQQIGNAPQLFQALYGECAVYAVRPQLHEMYKLAERFLSLAQQRQQSDAIVEGNFLLGYALFFMADLPGALKHLQCAIQLYGTKPRRELAEHYGHDPGMSCRFFASCTLWLLGHPEQARKMALECISLAKNVAHSFSLAYAHATAALAFQLQRDISLVREQAKAGMVLSREQGIPHFLSFAEAMWGWVLTEEGETETGIEHLCQGAAGWRSQGSELLQPYWLALLADAYGKTRQVNRALAAITEAFNIVDQTGETFYQPELYRLQGELMLQQANPQAQIVNVKCDAEASLRKAIEIASQQQSKWLELRAATSLARLFQKRGDCTAARDLLEPIHSWFTEGFETFDLKAAKALLEELAA